VPVLEGAQHLVETRWTYVTGNPSKTVEAWGGAFGGFCERSATSVDRLELPVAATVIILCCGEPVTLKSASTRRSAGRLYAFSAGLQVPAQCVTHAGINDCVEIRLPPLAAYALFGGSMSEANSDPINLFEVAPRPTAILLDRLRTIGCPRNSRGHGRHWSSLRDESRFARSLGLSVGASAT
jgi:hypothetical protein